MRTPLPARSSRAHRSLTVVAVTALVSLGLAACGSSEDDGGEGAETSQTRVFAADNGEITIPADPQRVVATGYAVPVLIEADAELVGISEWSRGLPLMSDEHAATYEELPKVAGETAAATSYEAVAEADPDLIVIGVPQPALVDLDMEKLESIAPVVVIGPTVPDAWKTDSEKQADAAGALEGFEEARDAYTERVEELKAEHADTLDGLAFGHVGAYGDISAGSFHREFAGSWGTNIATDVGVTYTGEVKKKGGGSADVSEYPSIEELPEAFADVDVITYTVGPDGKPSEEVQYVLDSQLWKNLPAVEAGRTLGLRFTEAVTYTSALKTLDALDAALDELR
ncbi:ABC transporter substrate-binding protein [Nocardioides sp. Y6]|uniref:ABC transporter substrate-binding protein n=1 Tax=Nocardioides malaquae TaxID=2773426 RepID=A0ABR9RW60_9ACTN|nr:ABC transporter substrate-binding protein [Nocardioides malaquae]MBE7325826.1 ABC transporter substrate-binding protein [Nocardioides malaquae]